MRDAMVKVTLQYAINRMYFVCKDDLLWQYDDFDDDDGDDDEHDSKDELS